MVRFAVIPSLVAVLALSAAPAPAQQFTILFKGGLNLADLSVDEEGETVETSTRTGIAVGAGVALGVHPVFAVQPELLYSQKGTETEIEDVTATLELDYVQIPLLARITIPTAGPVRPTLHAGPSVSFEVSCSVSASLQGVRLEVPCDEADILERSKVDFGILAGGGIEIDVARGISVSLEGRYELGLTNIDDSADPASVKTRNISVLGGVGIRLP